VFVIARRAIGLVFVKLGLTPNPQPSWLLSAQKEKGGSENVI